MATTIKLFGDHLLASQIVGLFEIAILAFALYSWLARLFAPTYAFFGAVSSILLCMANRTEALNALHLPGMFYAILAGAVATLSIDSEKTRVSFAFAGGIFAGLAFLAKQTSGIAAPFGLLFVLGVITVWLHGPLKAAKVLLTLSLGCGLPVIAVGAWLASRGALRDAISDLFLNGVSSKGSPLQMVLRIFWMTWQDGYLLRYFSLAAFIVAGFLIFYRKHLEDLVEAIAANRPKYEMLDSFVTPGSNKTVEVLVSANH